MFALTTLYGWQRVCLWFFWLAEKKCMQMVWSLQIPCNQSFLFRKWRLLTHEVSSASMISSAVAAERFIEYPVNNQSSLMWSKLDLLFSKYASPISELRIPIRRHIFLSRFSVYNYYVWNIWLRILLAISSLVQIGSSSGMQRPLQATGPNMEIASW